MQIKNEKLKSFLRRKGAYIAGGLILGGIVALAIIGKNSGGSSDVLYRYAEDKAEKEYSRASEEMRSPLDSEATEKLYAEVFGIDTEHLKYELDICGIDGENFFYRIYFDRDLPADIVQQFSAEIEKKCGKLAEDNYYGHIDIQALPEERTVTVYLDLGSSYEMKAINGICRAANEFEGITKVTINEFTDDLADLYDIKEAAKEYFSELLTYYPIEVESFSDVFEIRVMFKEKPTEETVLSIRNEAGTYLNSNGSKATISRDTKDENTVCIFCDSKAITTLLSQDMYFLVEETCWILNEKITGIDKVVIREWQTGT
ncbi:MAG: hypothetical protein IKP95_09090 [Ruminococcus sp.]|nr:hypothetical protein [Ruminococcus sp.]